MKNLSNTAIAMNVRNSVDAQGLKPAEAYVDQASRVGASTIRQKLNTAQRAADEKALNSPFARRYSDGNGEQHALYAIALRDPEQLQAISSKMASSAATFQRLALSAESLSSMAKMDVVEMIMTKIMESGLTASERKEWLDELKWGLDLA